MGCRSIIRKKKTATSGDRCVWGGETNSPFEKARKRKKRPKGSPLEQGEDISPETQISGKDSFLVSAQLSERGREEESLPGR